MIRDEEKQLHDLPETRGMTAREALAEAWASMDGKLEKFRACKADPVLEDEMGHYEGYLADAQSMIERLKARGFDVLPAIPVPVGKEGR